MLYIDSTYFSRELSIPNVDEMNSKALAELNLFIDEKVPFILQQALGWANYKDLLDNTTAGVLDADAPQKWKDLMNGVEYTKDGKSVKWRGLLFTEGSFKGSLLAQYVYYKWCMWQISYMTGVGEAKADAKNTSGVNSTQRLVTIYNTFLEMYSGIDCGYGNQPNFYYMGFVPVIDWFENNGSNVNISLFEFLRDHKEDYPDCALLIPEDMGVQNQLGL